MPSGARVKRCSWVGPDDLLMLDYHDREWGVPVHDDRTHFEFLLLEGAQAGLSWSTILKKREGYRRAFSDFDPERVARYTEKRRKAHGRSWHRTKSTEDRVGDSQRTRLPRSSKGIRKLRRVLLELRRRQTERRRTQSRATDSRDDTGVRRAQQGSEEARFQLRRVHCDLRVHAGRRTS